MNLESLATFVWDPPRDIFVIPFLNHPITWYGLLFTCSFIAAYFIVRYLFIFQLKSLGVSSPKTLATKLVDRLTTLTVIGVILGARLAHVFFYDWDYYKNHLSSILKVWEGGLASHGGAIGILVALLIFTLWQRHQKPKLTFLMTLDAVVMVAPLIGGFIRIGNFINQEILGTPTHLPWGVIFGHPMQPTEAIPLHPVQLYEALAYFLIFAILLIVWKKEGKVLGPGILSGWFFVLLFGFRFFIEFLKLPQSPGDLGSVLNMGQILSLPFIALGVGLLIRFSIRKQLK